MDVLGEQSRQSDACSTRFILLGVDWLHTDMYMKLWSHTHAPFQAPRCSYLPQRVQPSLIPQVQAQALRRLGVKKKLEQMILKQVIITTIICAQDAAARLRRGARALGAGLELEAAFHAGLARLGRHWRLTLTPAGAAAPFSVDLSLPPGALPPPAAPRLRPGAPPAQPGAPSPGGSGEPLVCDSRFDGS